MAKRTKMVWRTKEVEKAVDKATQKRLNTAGIFLTGNIKKSFGSAVAAPGGTSKKHRARNRSVPGGPPNVDTGLLRRSITHQLDDGITFVGSFGGVKYARILELGGTTKAHQIPNAFGSGVTIQHPGSRIEARPYLRPALDRNKSKLRRILSRKMTKEEER